MRQVSLAVILLLGLSVYAFDDEVFAPLSSPTQLTFNTRSDRQPVISSDGSRIAFSSDLNGDFDIFMMNSDGTNLLPLTPSNSNDTSPSINANGGKVAFQSASGNDADIFTINSDGTGLLRLTGSRPLWGNFDDTDPAISGDGLWVAFVSNDDPLGLNPEGDDEIFLIRTDRTGLSQLTVNSRDDATPSISADGGKAAFQTNLGTWEIFTVNSDRTGLTQISNNEGATTQSFTVSISADGSSVAYDSAALAPASSREMMRVGPEQLSSQVYVASSSGVGQPRQVSATGGDNFTPSISRDGSRVTYVSTEGGDTEVYVVDSNGTGQPVAVTLNTTFDEHPSIDFDGGTVAFASNLDGDYEIFAAFSAVIHDVAVTQVAVPRRVGYNAISSNPLQVNVTVTNQGNVDETVTVEVSFLAGPVLSTQTSPLPTASSRVLTFGVSPEFLALGTYTLVARAIPVVGESDTADNTFVDGTIEVRIPGDVDGDRDVDIIDAATMALAFGRTCGVVGYIAASDFDNDCDVDIIDAAILASRFGTVG